MLPLGSRDQVELVRERISQRVHDALMNHSWLRAEAERTNRSQVFSLHKLEEIWGVAWNNLATYGRIVSEEEVAAMTLRFANDSLPMWAQIGPTLKEGFCIEPQRSL
jgi:hypothetical protein